MAHIGIKFVEDRDDVSNDGCISSSRVWGFSTFTPMFSHKIIWTARNRTGKQLEGAEVSDGVSPADWGLAIQLIFITFRLIHSFLGWGRALTLQALVTDPTQTPSWHRRLYIISQKGIYPVNASGCQTGNGWTLTVGLGQTVGCYVWTVVPKILGIMAHWSSGGKGMWCPVWIQPWYRFLYYRW